LGGREILLNNPYVDDILVYEPFWFYKKPFRDYLKFLGQLRKRRFDLVIETRADIRDILFLVFPARSRIKLSYAVGGGSYFLSHVAPYEKLKHKVEYHLDLVRYLGFSTDSMEWGIYLTTTEKEEVARLLKDSGVSTSFICVHPGGRLPLKRWPTQRCASLYDRMIDRLELPLVILSTGSEIGLVGQIAGMMRNRPILLAGKTTIRQLSGVIAEAALLVCNDSAPMHIAAALGTPTVAIFGPSKSIETRPYFNNSRIVEKDFPCRNNCDETICRHNVYHECMRSITPGEVFQVCLELIEHVGIRRWPCSIDHRSDARAD
jgi:ADP-heptose:LPS heptosyltransferase